MLDPLGHCLVDTAFGRLALAWTELGITHVQLPEADDEETVARLHRRAAARSPALTPPPSVAAAAERLQRHLARGDEDLSDIALDLRAAPEFYRSVYERARRVGPGVTISYGELARSLGSVGLARAVGTAMAKNPCAVVVPCHRVMAAGGGAGGFSAHGGLRTKARLLALEGAALPEGLRALVAGPSTARRRGQTTGS